MTTLDKAREMARRMREPPNVNLDVARLLDGLIATVEASQRVTDAEIHAAGLRLHGKLTPEHVRWALEAAAAARSRPEKQP